MVDRKRNSWPYRRAAERARQATSVCICGRPIDRSLPKDHPASASANHAHPVGLGGDLLGPMYGMHRVCNMRLGTRAPTPEVIAELASRPLEYDRPQPKKNSRARHAREWW